MKQELKILLAEVEKKVGKSITLASDFEKLAIEFARHRVSLHPSALRKVWMHLADSGKPTPETLDKIALFVGFQSWKDFKEALHGEGDGQSNYEL